ncbi:Pyridinium-3,5-bisthiocarboxylic acid mononucleotide synthase [subsurface metagenome]
MEEKLASLKKILSNMGSVLIAFSGGVDSTFLLKVAHDVLGKKIVAATASSETYPASELEAAKKIARKLGVKHLIIQTEELTKQDFAKNSPQRCYFCKRELFSRLNKIARGQGLNYVADASNYDDLADFRPGRQAGQELGIKSPLKEARLTKAEIRSFSHKMNLPTWNKPSLACLASRIPYGTRITREKLKRIDEGERFLKGLGIRQLRIRDHDGIARIEVPQEEMNLFWQGNMVRLIIDKLKRLGYTYVTLDLEGYRPGSMNEVLEKR